MKSVRGSPSALAWPPLPVATGFDKLAENGTCHPPVGNALPQAVRAVRAFPTLDFVQPVALKQRPGDPARYYVVEQTGRIKTFLLDDTTAELALDLKQKWFTQATNRVCFRWSFTRPARKSTLFIIM